ncbi:hypothetical protein [Pandoraea sputorum]|uniref:Uncharacterized protein n=1 Tax=Pandoraea sputorum TaxID=93222 RepID=A0A5E5BFP4_9BURK|nr:hypothetical protein [Pandoraea sputorum]VVE84981.1 hypothetical protein PSP31121_05025 [Pandoraea sputorum]
MDLCPLCRANAGRLDFTKPCCRVRHLMALPRVEMRRATLDRWRTQLGETLMTQIENEVKARWAARKA